MRLFFCGWTPRADRFRRQSGGGADECGQSNEIVGGHREGELEGQASRTAQLRSAAPADALAPAEWFFGSLALLMADGIARVSCGAPVDGRPSAAVILSDVRRHVQRAQVVDELSCIVGLVRTQRDAL